MLLQNQKQETRRSKLNEAHIVLKNRSFEDLKTKICVDVKGCMENTQDYGLDHP
jgi:hypothetical protein